LVWVYFGGGSGDWPQSFPGIGRGEMWDALASIFGNLIIGIGASTGVGFRCVWSYSAIALVHHMKKKSILPFHRFLVFWAGALGMVVTCAIPFHSRPYSEEYWRVETNQFIKYEISWFFVIKLAL
jgi:hypothetical protein